MLFPNYFNNLAEHKYEYLYKEDYYTLYLNCAAYAITEMNNPRNADLKSWIRQTANYHKNLGKAADYSYSGLLYRMFGFSPFNDILDTDTSSGVKDQRPMRNLSKFTQIVEQFEYLYNIQVLTPQRVENTTEIFFNLYLRLLYDGGIREFESEEEYKAWYGGTFADKALHEKAVYGLPPYSKRWHILPASITLSIRR